MTDAGEFLELYEDSFVRLDGLPFEEGPSDWHVNERFMVSTGEEALTDLLRQMVDDEGDTSEVAVTFVLQRADASEEWLAFALKTDDDTLAFDSTYRFKGTRTNPEPIDAQPVIVETAGPSGFREEP